MHVSKDLSNVLSLNTDTILPRLSLHFRRDTLRGALSDGHSWVFIIVVLNPDGNGAKYRYCAPIEFRSGMPIQIAKPWPDVLAGILFHWVSLAPPLIILIDIGIDKK
jgi:hypothetical protein